MATRRRQPQRNLPPRRDWSDALVRHLSTALRFALVLAAIAILAAGALQLASNLHEPRRVAAPEPAAEVYYPPAMGEISAPEPVKPSDRGGLTVFGLMAQEAERSPDLQEFVMRARQRPEAGGVSYAAAALTYCDRWQVFREERTRLEQELASAVGRRGLKAPERLNVILQALDRCEGLSAEETSLQSIFTLYDSEAAKRDRVLVARARLQGAKSIEERQLAVRDILLMRDPLLLVSVGRYLGQGLTGVVPQVDGLRWGGVSEEAYVNAWLLVPCSFGLACDETDPEVALACAQYGHCFSGRKEMLRARLSPQDYANMLRLHQRLIEIVIGANAEALRFRATP